MVDQSNGATLEEGRLLNLVGHLGDLGHVVELQLQPLLARPKLGFLTLLKVFLALDEIC